MVKTPLLKPSPGSTSCPQLTAFGKPPTSGLNLELCLKCVLVAQLVKNLPAMQETLV